MRVLTWNLFHGRARPPVRRGLLAPFAVELAGWDWDVALLQEVPPWWPEPLARATGASDRHVRMTSRNWLGPLQRAIGSRNPELLKSNAGGCNLILVRGGRLEQPWAERLRWWPERRWAHGGRVGAVHVVNLHAEQRDGAVPDVGRALARALREAGGAPLVFGGDLNCSRDAAAKAVAPLTLVASRHVDHVAVRGLRPSGAGAQILDAGDLSDHRPLLIDIVSE